MTLCFLRVRQIATYTCKFFWSFLSFFLILIFIFKTWIFELIILTRSHGFLNFKCTMVQPEFSRLLRFFIPQKGTNQIQVFRILTNHHRVFLRNKKNALNEKTRAEDLKNWHLHYKQILNSFYIGISAIFISI